MIKFLALVVLVGVATVAADPVSQSMTQGTPEGRIIGGHSVAIEEVPYQVHILFNDNPYCGGSIIAARWVLTAGHCATQDRRRYSILSGAAKLFSGKVSAVERIVQHENYREEKYGIPVNDVALFRTAKAFVMSLTQKIIPLYKIGEVTKVGSNATITGWGTIKQNFTVIPQNLQMVIVPIMNTTQCKSAYISLTDFKPGQICAGYPNGGKDACQGDSGGPLAIEGRQAGIVSWGNGCALPGQPGVYAEVAAYREWIDKKMKYWDSNGSTLTQTVSLGTISLITIAHMTSALGVLTQ